MKKFFLLFILVIQIPLFMPAQNSEKPKTALLLIDIQDFYFPGGYNPLNEPEAASSKAAVVLDSFRRKNEPVLFVKHAVKKDSLINSSVLPLESEKVITKHEINSYLNTDLLDFLRENKVQRLVICGMMTHVCVEAAARASSDYGFEVIVLGDACATRDIEFKGSTIKAQDVHMSTLATIASYYGQVLTVEEFLEN